MSPLPANPDPAAAFPGHLMFARPLVGVECLKSFLGLNEHEVRAEIAAGRLRWAFDLRANGDKQFLRVLSVSMIGWKCPELQPPRDLNAVLDLILPAASHTNGAIKSTTLQCALNVVSGHIRHLLRAGKLKLVKGCSPGPGVPALITRASVVELLRQGHADLLDNLSYNTCAVKRHGRNGLSARGRGATGACRAAVNDRSQMPDPRAQTQFPKHSPPNIEPPTTSLAV